MKKILVLMLVIATLFPAVHFSYIPVQAEGEVVIDFEGLGAGSIVDSVSYGQGIQGALVDGMVMISGNNPSFPNQNAAMIFDAACPGGCTGNDDDLNSPVQGMVLIVSEDMDSSDPDDAAYPVTMEFDFQNLGTGKFIVDTLTIGDIDPSEAGGNIEFYAGGSGGALLATVPIPVTGNGVFTPLSVNVSGVDYMRVSLVGSGAVDDIVLFPEMMEEVLYLSDTVIKYDGISRLFQVQIDDTNMRANLTLLPNGVLNYDHVDAIACTPDGAKIYFIDEDNKDVNSPSILGYYDVETATVTEVGNLNVAGTTLRKIDQAAFSPDGILYITGNITDKLYRVDLTTAEVFEIGTVVDDLTGATLNIVGSDIAFHADGSMYLFVNNEGPNFKRGLYLLTLPPQNGPVLATFLGAGTDPHKFRGLAVRANGNGDLVGSTGDDEIHVFNRVNADDLLPPLPVYLDGVLYDLAMGDMSIGPFASGRSNFIYRIP